LDLFFIFLLVNVVEELEKKFRICRRDSNFSLIVIMVVMMMMVMVMMIVRI
jgi:predicted PurR-regulated permease PerM